MISCDDCQKKLVAILDKESAEEDEKLVSLHLKDCPRCRAFREDIVKLRQRFTSTAVPGLPALVRQEVIQLAHADSRRRDNRHYDAGLKSHPLWLRIPRLPWAAGLAALFLIAVSWIVSFNLAQKVKVLKQELETSRRELALARQEEQLKEAQDRQQKAISALYFRMQELEERVEESGPSRSAYLPVKRSGL